MNGFAFHLEPCCGGWTTDACWQPVPWISKALLVCQRCGQRRVVTVTSRQARTDEIIGKK